MSEIMLCILDVKARIHGRIHGHLADVVVAALSADPETIKELEVAMARFVDLSEGPSPLAHFSSGACEKPGDAGIRIVDLAARLVVNDSNWSSPESNGEVAFHDGETATDVRLPYHLGEDWRIENKLAGWSMLAERRRRERQINPPWDAREVLYGSIAEYITDQCLTFVSLGDTHSDPVVDIHTRWLLTAREDLRGLTPHEVLLARHQAIDMDLWDRCAQWSFLGECPPGLVEESDAFRYGGFGTHEIVLYYDLMRFLLEACWERVRRHPDLSPAAEIRHLERLQQEWLVTPQPDLHQLSPAETIASERQRIPLVVPRDDIPVDGDCPLCRMMAESSGPTFWHLDGCNMDDEFAFSFCRTRKEWEMERIGSASVQRSEGEDFGEAPVGRLEEEPLVAAGSETIWQRSHAFADALEGLPAAAVVPTMLFTLGAHLAELGLDLKESSESVGFVALLNGDFAELRGEMVGLDSALIGATVARFRENLASAAAARPDLVEKCADLESQLLAIQEHLGITE